MDANGIIGREYEQKLILERCNSCKAELIAVYGRRRVGHRSLQLFLEFMGLYGPSAETYRLWFFHHVDVG